MISVISWFSIKHISFYVYLILINILSGLLFYSFRKKQIDEYSIKYTFLLLMGAIGGTIGGFISVIATRHVTKFNYAVLGFPIMLIGQVVFSMYMMSIGIF